ncbi:dopamine receptor 2 [Caerostris extrusa]|uniref:Dopamine receptor 2 n=1 Tax=Caerostris extrusa TaxID=172846 RepID=A0AAV4VCT2_CAEEX|nr:dopamine receptor 2 [Caerostris extrusa]
MEIPLYSSHHLIIIFWQLYCRSSVWLRYLATYLLWLLWLENLIFTQSLTISLLHWLQQTVLLALLLCHSVLYLKFEGYWPFGQDWCDIWRSIDVLASTASILNLCVISLDRYWAITDSMSYPRKMSPTRAGILIAVVWVCSALISFPAIAWWRAVSTFPPPEYQCLFTEDVGYLVFSSAVSFYVPLTVMLFTYYKIYRAAMEQKKSLKLGTKQVHAMNGEQCASLTLRIHRGGMFSPKYDPKLTNGDHHNDDYHERTSLKVPSRHMKSFSLSRKISKLAKERKAAKKHLVLSWEYSYFAGSHFSSQMF